MQTIPYSKTMKIVNTEQLPRGLGAKYLEVMSSHIPDTYIAVQWHRKLPARLKSWHSIVEFRKEK